MGIMEIFILVIGIVLVIWLVIYAARQAGVRRDALRAWAQGQGYRFSADKDHAMDERYECFSPLQQGDNRYAYNNVQGEADGKLFHAFDYHYQTYSTDSKGNRTTHHHTFTALIMDAGLRFPHELRVRPEGWFDKLTALVGFDDIDFESHEFSRAFYVKSRDRKFAYDVIHPRMMEFLLAHRGYAFELDGGAIFVALGERSLNPLEWPKLIEFATEVLHRLPDYLVDELSGREDKRGSGGARN